MNAESTLVMISSGVTGLTRGQFNNVSARRRSLIWYLSLFVMCKAWHKYNECPRVLVLLNSPLMYQSQVKQEISLKKIIRSDSMEVG